MELRHLRYFVGVAEALNFRAAARKLHVSAPALSQQIKSLEEEMDVRLFDRESSGVRLTNAGKVFLNEARSLLEAATQAQEAAKDAAQTARSRLRVGYNSAVLGEFMPRCLMVFSSKFPHTDVELIDLNAAEQVTGLETGTIQLGFVALAKGSAPPAGIASMPVMRATPHAVVGRKHRLAGLPAIPLAELAHERFLVVSGPRWELHRDNIAQFFRVLHHRPPAFVEVTRLDALLAMVAGGRGVTLLPWRRGVAYADDIVIAPLKESGPKIELEILALWRESQTSVLRQDFVAVLREVAEAKG
jgi:DNA-binding transcriptional LysR family regulator